ncbi:MAG TPA: hypothetical protein VH253_10875 [Phycisphaerae bacterium]|nr:hypothetical protein [Phycisphaerae bacterium]
MDPRHALNLLEEVMQRVRMAQVPDVDPDDGDADRLWCQFEGVASPNMMHMGDGDLRDFRDGLENAVDIVANLTSAMMRAAVWRRVRGEVGGGA